MKNIQTQSCAMPFSHRANDYTEKSVISAATTTDMMRLITTIRWFASHVAIVVVCWGCHPWEGYDQGAPISAQSQKEAEAEEQGEKQDRSKGTPEQWTKYDRDEATWEARQKRHEPDDVEKFFQAVGQGMAASGGNQKPTIQLCQVTTYQVDLSAQGRNGECGWDKICAPLEKNNSQGVCIARPDDN
jgi:hypothetical protein